MRTRRATAVLFAAGVGFAAWRGLEPRSISAASFSAPVSRRWLKTYPIEPYAEYWRLKLRVPVLNQFLPKVIDVLNKNKGRSNIPLDHAVANRIPAYQQLSYQLPAKSAEKALKALGKFGEIESLVKTPSSYPGMAAEVRGKLAELRAETAANQEALGRMPAVSSVVSELTEHLSLVERVGNESDGKILLNIEMEEKPLKQ